MFFIDKGGVVQTGKAYLSPQGHLRCDAIVTAARVLKYVDTNGQALNVLRHPDEVFHPESLKSLSGLPVTVSHPIDDSGTPILVTPENFSKYGVGTLGDSIIAQNPYVKVDGLNIQSEKGLEAITQGNKQLSPGYLATIVKDSGIFQGVKYDHRQLARDDIGYILYNHTAIMDVGEFGRNGDDVRLLIGDSVLIDTGYEFQDEKPVLIDLKPTAQFGNRTQMETNKMNKLFLVDCQSAIKDKPATKGVFTVDSDGFVHIPQDQFQTICDLNNAQFSALMDAQALSQEMGPIVAILSALNFDSVDSLATAYRENKAELETIRSVPTVDSELITKLVKQRSLLIDSAQKHLTKDTDLHSMTDRDIKLAVLNLYDSETEWTSIEDPEINGAYKAAIHALDSGLVNVQKQSNILKTVQKSKTPVADMSTIRTNIRQSRKA